MKNKRVLFIVSIAIVLVSYFGFMMTVANNTVPSKECIVPTNNNATVNFPKDNNHRLILTNVADEWGNWIVMVQYSKGVEFEEKDILDPQYKFETPMEIGGMIIELKADRTFYIRYPGSGTCELDPLF
jgi:hypothetical protein